MCCLSDHRGGAPFSCPKEGNGAHFTRHSVPAKHHCQHFIRTSHGLNNDPLKETLLYPILQLRKQRIREVNGLAQSHTASQCGFPHAELEYKKGLFDPLHSPFCSSQDIPPQDVKLLPSLLPLEGGMAKKGGEGNQEARPWPGEGDGGAQPGGWCGSVPSCCQQGYFCLCLSLINALRAPSISRHQDTGS